VRRARQDFRLLPKTLVALDDITESAALELSQRGAIVFSSRGCKFPGSRPEMTSRHHADQGDRDQASCLRRGSARMSQVLMCREVIPIKSGPEDLATLQVNCFRSLSQTYSRIAIVLFSRNLSAIANFSVVLFSKASGEILLKASLAAVIERGGVWDHFQDHSDFSDGDLWFSMVQDGNLEILHGKLFDGRPSLTPD